MTISLAQENTENLQKCKSELVRTQQAAVLAQQTIDKLNATCEKLDQVRLTIYTANLAAQSMCLLIQCIYICSLLLRRELSA